MPDMNQPNLQAYFQKNTVVDENGCWIWQRSITALGYGQASRKYNGKQYRTAHRLSYAVHVGEIPEGLILDHLCRVRRCANPEHLEPVTHYVNGVERGRGPTAKNARKTHCLYGHPFTVDNLCSWRTRRGGRQCKLCDQRRQAQYRQKRRDMKKLAKEVLDATT